jgi:uncharacterized protein involved in cysteine biosynthesis
MKPMLHSLNAPTASHVEADRRLALALRAALAVAAVAALVAGLLLAALAEVGVDSAQRGAPAFEGVAPLEAPAA